MATISVPYMTYEFIPPLISESTYYTSKEKLKIHPDFTLLEKDPSISEEFKDEIKLGRKYFFLMIIAIIVGALLSDKSEWLDIISFICLLIFLFCLFGSIILWGGFLLSIINYKRYLREKRYFYANMKRSIIQSENYKEFMKNFYGLDCFDMTSFLERTSKRTKIFEQTSEPPKTLEELMDRQKKSQQRLKDLYE